MSRTDPPCGRCVSRARDAARLIGHKPPSVAEAGPTGEAADAPVTDARVRADTRRQLVRLIAHELSLAWDAAVMAGADVPRLTWIIDRRRETIERSRNGLDDSPS